LYKGLFIVVFPVPGHVKDMHGIGTVLTLEAAGEGFALHSGGALRLLFLHITIRISPLSIGL